MSLQVEFFILRSFMRLYDPGLAGHIPITMDLCGGDIFQDNFESGFDKWTDGGYTDWSLSNPDSKLS